MTMKIIPKSKFNKPEKKKNVAAYARVSMECEKLKHSLSQQISYYSALIQNNPLWNYKGVYADYGISGTSLSKREEFNRLIDDCKAGKIDIILTKSISRFARNTVDLLNVVRELKDIGVEVRFEKERINSLSKDGELMLSILAGFAQAESESISANCKWGLRKRMERGIIQHKDLFGFTYENGQYKIVDDEARIIREVFDLFLSGKTYTEIASIINDKGIKTRTGIKWNYGSIKDMLKQEKYAGFTIAQKRYVCNSLTHKSIRNHGELPMYKVENTHPAIISEDIYNKAKKKIEVLATEWKRIHMKGGVNK